LIFAVASYKMRIMTSLGLVCFLGLVLGAFSQDAPSPPDALPPASGPSPPGDLTPTDCGGVQTLEGSGTIMSPNYPDNYPNNANCVYELSVPADRVVRVSVEQFEIEYEPSGCIFDALEFQDGNIADFVCGSDTDGCSFVSTTNSLTVVFRTDSSVTRGGFSLSFEPEEPGTGVDPSLLCQLGVDSPGAPGGPGGPYMYYDMPELEINDCGGLQTLEGSGTILTPDYPDNYPNNVNCQYVITAPEGMVVRISTAEMDIESHSSCNYDALELSEPDTTAVKLCGTYDGCDFVSAGNVLNVLFRTDGSVTRGGFSLSYEAVAAGTQPENQCNAVA